MKKILAAFCLFGFAVMAANEIQLTWSITASKGNLYATRQQSKQFTINNPSPNVSSYTISVTTQAAGHAITAGALQTNGWGWVINTSTGTPTNITSGAYSVDIGTQVAGTFYPVIRLNPGEGHPIRFAPNVTNWARSNSGTNNPVVLECPIIDN